MKTQLSDTYINLWLKVLVFSAIVCIIFAGGRETLKYNELQKQFAEYKIQTNTDIERLNMIAKQSTERLKSFGAVQKEIQCLALNVYFEAASEPYEGMLAVAVVTRNRVNSNAFPKTYCGVVYQRNAKGCQFSWTCDGLPDRIRSQTAFNKAVQVAEEVFLDDKKSSIINGNVMNYHANYVDPKWSKDRPLVATIGNHLFYGKRYGD